MSVPARVVTLLLAFLAVVAGASFLVIHYLLGGPPVEDFTAGVALDAFPEVVSLCDPRK